MTIYIGYATLEEMLHCVRLGKLFFFKYEEQHVANGAIGLGVNDYYVCCQQPDGDGWLRYWRMKVATYTTIQGRFFHPHERDVAFEMAKSAYDELLGYLHAHDREPEHALLAMPKDYKYLDGTTDLLTLDKETKRWKLYAKNIHEKEPEGNPTTSQPSEGA